MRNWRNVLIAVLFAWAFFGVTLFPMAAVTGQYKHVYEHVDNDVYMQMYTADDVDFLESWAMRNAAASKCDGVLMEDFSCK